MFSLGGIPSGLYFYFIILKIFAPSNIIILVCYAQWRTYIMEYMTANQAAKQWNISQRRVQILCSEDRIPGVFKLGEAWAIPADEEKPEDPRRLKNNKKDE